MLRKIKHALGEHEWRHYGSLDGASERVCVHPTCERVEELVDGVWKEKKTE